MFRLENFIRAISWETVAFVLTIRQRGIVKIKNMNDRLVKEKSTNDNPQNCMIHYLGENIYAEANR